VKWSRTRRRAALFGATLAAAPLAQLIVMCGAGRGALVAFETPMGILTAGASLLGATILALLAILNQQTARLRDLLRRALSRLSGAQKGERERIARELHDGVSQMLLCARHTLERAASPCIDSQQRATLLAQGLQQLDEAIVEIRRVSHGYKSILLTGRDFTEALKVLGSEFAGRTRIQLDLEGVDAAVDEMLNTSAKGSLLRIAQEALTNVQRHSGASRVQLAVHSGIDHVELRVSDNGRRGLACNGGSNAAPGIGIKNMQERAAALGGSLSVRRTGSHTEVVARVPPFSRRCGAKQL
jgi:two-component system, NarL family, sensor kinase